MLDLVIKNGVIVDGTGKNRFFGEVGVKDGKIVKVAQTIDEPAENTIDAAYHVVAPGFIDMHRHSDLVVFREEFGELELRQGLTTVIGGMCGLSAIPCPPEKRDLILNRLTSTISFDRSIPFNNFKEYAEQVEKRPLAINYGNCVGSGVSRLAVVGYSNDELTEEQMDQISEHIRESLEDGALGLTMGVAYSPDMFYNVDGFCRVFKPMQNYNVPIIAHIRGESDNFIDAIKEAIQIATTLNVPLNICHFKCEGRHNWGHRIKEAIRIVEEARENGLEITIDVYPYQAGSCPLSECLPPEFLVGGADAVVERLSTPEGRQRAKEVLSQFHKYFDNLLLYTGWNKVLISSVKNPELSEFVGMTLAEIAEKTGKDPYDATFDLIVADHCATYINYFAIGEFDSRLVMQHPLSSIISDAGYRDVGLPHPRTYAAFPHFIKEYVVKENLMSIETAVNKITLKPAQLLHLKGKGKIEEGMDADIVIFDPNAIDTKATFLDPKQLATGFDYVIVNGEIAIKDDEWLKTRSGKFLRRGVDTY